MDIDLSRYSSNKQVARVSVRLWLEAICEVLYNVVLAG